MPQEQKTRVANVAGKRFRTTLSNDQLKLWVRSGMRPMQGIEPIQIAEPSMLPSREEGLRGADPVGAIKENLPGLAAGGLIAAAGPVTIPTAIGLGIIGGGGGEAIKQIGERVFQPEKAPTTGMEATERI